MSQIVSMKNIKQSTLIVLLCLMSILTFAQTPYYLYIGTYTRKTSEGIYIYKFNTKTGFYACLFEIYTLKN